MTQVGFKPTSMRTFNYLIFYFTIAYKEWIIISTQIHHFSTQGHIHMHGCILCEARKFLKLEPHSNNPVLR